MSIEREQRLYDALKRITKYIAILSLLDELEKARAELERARAGARWYCVNHIGQATLCADEADARESATEYDAMWPRAAPHRAVLLGDVAAIDAALRVGGKEDSHG